jgi:cytochrome P450
MSDVTLDPVVIPEIDPGLLPLIVDDGSDWRAVCDELRETYEFFRVRGDQDSTIWFTRYETVRELFLDWKTFTANKDYTGRFLIPGSLEPPRSVAFRRALMPMYGPEHVKRWEGRMRAVARELIGRFHDRGECDFMDEFAIRFFPYIGSEMLGAPPEDWDMLSQLEHEMFAIDPDALIDDLPHLQPLRTDGEDKLVAYINDLIAARRAEPREDFISFVCGLELDGVPLGDREVRAIALHYVLGASKTVSAHLGYIIKHLIDDVDLRRALIADPPLIETAGEELLRMHSLWGFPRTTTRDVVFHGCPLERGQRVFALVTMTNRDPRVPGFDTVDYTRHPNKHLAFMVGVHQCIGIHWARMARRVAIGEWLTQIPDYRLKEGVRIIEQPYMGVGFHNLPLVWT